VVSNDAESAWPGSHSYIVLRLDGGTAQRVAEHGDLNEVRPWASVSKMTVAMAFGVEVDWDLHSYDEQVGPHGATFANLLSHSSGLGLEESDSIVPIATKRVYSNYGYDRAVQAIVGENDPAEWLVYRVFDPLGLSTTSLEGRPAAGVSGSTEDLATLAVAWLRCDGISRPTRDRLIRPYLPDLAGIVPGFGRFTPCPWGIGPEVRGEKRHWMGDWPATSFGHFGMSGSMMLLNAEEGIAVVATSSEPFGAWAVKLWPEWTSVQRAVALSS
jgi:CubicO group peptidase (beta-lactamase class C family)